MLVTLGPKIRNWQLYVNIGSIHAYNREQYPTVPFKEVKSD